LPVDAGPCVLVVDDDTLVRESLGSALRRSGFTVHLAASGQEAIEVYRRHGGDIDVVLLDLRMPGMDGPQTLVVLRELNPTVRCCFVTGYIEGYSREELLAMGADDLLFKPVGTAEVVQTLRRLLTPEGEAT
jgi:CheY-like chemotaxis protein